ncbi:MAG: hypothetical protein ABWK05_08410 [Pyrobaculum sp.]
MCRIEKVALKKGLTLSTARWLCELAKELGIGEGALLKAAIRLAKSGVWLEDEDWRAAAKALDLSKYLDMVVDYLEKRVKSGVPPAQAVKELPEAAAKAGVLAHIREVLANLI